MEFLEDNLKKSARVSTIGPLSRSVWVKLWNAARGPALLKSQNKGGLLLKSWKADVHTHTHTPVSPVTDVRFYTFCPNWPPSDALAVVLSLCESFVVFNCLTWLRSLQMGMLLVLDSGWLFYVFVLLNGFNIQQIAAGCLQISRLWRWLWAFVANPSKCTCKTCGWSV